MVAQLDRQVKVEVLGAERPLLDIVAQSVEQRADFVRRLQMEARKIVLRYVREAVLQRLQQESKEGASGQVLTRIRFVPAKRAKSMTLTFRLA